MEQRRAVVDRRAIELLLDARQQAADVGARLARGRKPIGRDAREAQLVKRSCQRFRKPRHRGDWREVRQLARGDRVEHGACGDGFNAGLRAGRVALARQPCRGRSGRELG